VVLLYQCGQSPAKEEIKFTFPIPVNNRVSIVTLAMPKYRRRPDPVRAAKLFANGKNLGVSQALMDVEATAVRDLWDQAVEIAFRQAVRAAGRVAAQEAARRQSGGQWAFLAVVIVGHILEQADLRSWLALPRDFQILRVPVPAGTHRFDMDLLASGPIGRVTLDKVPVREAGTTIINLRSVGRNGTAQYVAF